VWNFGPLGVAGVTQERVYVRHFRAGRHGQDGTIIRIAAVVGGG
jgi:hypothetical protein